jgi:hypothetical protein
MHRRAVQKLRQNVRWPQIVAATEAAHAGVPRESLDVHCRSQNGAALVMMSRGAPTHPLLCRCPHSSGCKRGRRHHRQAT